jgi:hypothetical protein
MVRAGEVRLQGQCELDEEGKSLLTWETPHVQ